MREILSTLFSPWNTSLYINVLQNITDDKCIRKLILAEPPLLLLYISISDSAWNWIVNNINSNKKNFFYSEIYRKYKKFSVTSCVIKFICEEDKKMLLKMSDEWKRKRKTNWIVLHENKMLHQHKMQVTLSNQKGYKFKGKSFFMMILLYVFIVQTAYGFNVDVRSHVAYSRPEGTMFGFAVTAHREGDTGW